jgi:hypothetical protein
MSLDQLMVDAIDLHVHGAPEPFEVGRRVDLLTLGKIAKDFGMKALVIKSIRFGTGTLTIEVNGLLNSSILVGSLVLNYDAGGLNPDIVDAQGRAGAKVVWLPTISSAAHMKTRGKGKGDNVEGINIIDRDDKLIPEMVKILDIMARNKQVLATGHISRPEVFAVVKEARRRKINVIVTHPLAGPAGPLISLAEARELADMGAFIENTFAHVMPPALISPSDISGYIKAIGPEHCVLSTDFGQIFNPPAPEGFHMMLAIMLMFGLTEDDLQYLVKINPAKILGLI